MDTNVKGSFWRVVFFVEWDGREGGGGRREGGEVGCLIYKMCPTRNFREKSCCSGTFCFNGQLNERNSTKFETCFERKFALHHCVLAKFCFLLQSTLRIGRPLGDLTEHHHYLIGWNVVHQVSTNHIQKQQSIGQCRLINALRVTSGWWSLLCTKCCRATVSVPFVLNKSSPFSYPPTFTTFTQIWDHIKPAEMNCCQSQFSCVDLHNCIASKFTNFQIHLITKKLLLLFQTWMFCKMIFLH